MRIQHNIMAMNAYRNYTNNTSALSKNLEKLSSGYKINRAGDDAAGLAISEKMRAQITGLATAQKNAKDGISLVQTAEGALTEVHSMLNRMVELADQSANGTYDDGVDRANLQKEFDALRGEIDRISKSTNFNGINLLDGTQAGSTTKPTFNLSDVSVGAISTAGNTFVAGTEGTKGVFTVDFSDFSVTNTSNVAQTVTIKIGTKDIGISVDAGKTLEGKAFADKVKTALGGAMTNGTTVSGSSATFGVTQNGSVFTFTMADVPTTTANDASKTNFGVTITAATNDMTHNNAINKATTVQTPAAVKTQEKAAHLNFTLTAADIVDGGAVKIGDQTYVFALGADSKYKDAVSGNGVTIVDLTGTAANASDKLAKATAALTNAAKDNKLFTVGSETSGTFTLTTKLDAVDKNGLYTLADGTKLDFKSGTVADYAGLIKKGTAPEELATATTGGLTLQIGDTSDSFNQLSINIGNMNCASLGISAASINIDTQGNASDAVSVLKNAINSVSSTRGDLGALQNRLEHTINNLSVMEENIQDAEASIRDVDVAKEMMSYTKNNILVQSAQAMLAQANQVPQGVLQLLQ